MDELAEELTNAARLTQVARAVAEAALFEIDKMTCAASCVSVCILVLRSRVHNKTAHSILL